MRYPEFACIPQPAFSGQRNEERIFVIAQRNIISFASSLLIVFILIFIPIIFTLINLTQTATLLTSFPPLVDDLIIIAIMVYYLTLFSLLAVFWLRFYYSEFIVTDSRVIEIDQTGFFNRKTQELLFGEWKELREIERGDVKDVSFRSRGIWGILFSIGDIMILRNSVPEPLIIESVPNANLITFIINSFREQSAHQINAPERIPEIKTYGMIGNHPIVKGSEPLPIMNFSRNIIEAQKKIRSKYKKPRGWSMKFDHWWWREMKRENAIYIDYNDWEFQRLLHGWEANKDKEGESEGKTSV